MGNVKKKILEYSITTLVCSLVVFLIVLIRGIFKVEETKTVMHYLTDAFFTVGIITAGVGLLIFASNGGAYDMLVYGMYRFITLFRRKNTKIKYETFYDYHVAKAERPKAEFLFLVIIGVVFIGISMIFLYNYYQY